MTVGLTLQTVVGLDFFFILENQLSESNSSTGGLEFDAVSKVITGVTK